MLRFLKTGALVLALAALLPWTTQAWTTQASAAAPQPDHPADHPPDQWQADPPGHWWTIPYDDITTPSRCRRQTTTPACAVEVRLACYFTRNSTLCEKLKKSKPETSIEVLPLDKSERDHFVKYRLPLVEKVTVGQADAVKGAASQPGDYRVDMQFTYCHNDTKVCREDSLPLFNFLLREVDGEWRSVAWDSHPLLQTGETVPGTTLPKEQWMADPPDLWRILTNSDDTPNTSRCIGQTTSPVCAVETMLACYRRSTEKFCRKAVLDTGWTKFNKYPNRSIGYEGFIKYRLLLVETVTVGQPEAVGGATSQPGDYQIDVQVTDCSYTRNRCDTDIGPPIHFLLREVGGDWKIVGWGSNPPLKTGELIPGTTRLKEQWQADPPDRWRIFSVNENIPNTSRCLGQRTSPLCAVETRRACKKLGNEELCKMEGYNDENRNFIAIKPEVYFEHYVSYRFPVVREVREGEQIEVDDETVAPGDYVVEYEETDCNSILKRCFRTFGSRTTYVLWKVGDNWRIYHTFNPDYEDEHPGMPD